MSDGRRVLRVSVADTDGLGCRIDCSLASHDISAGTSDVTSRQDHGATLFRIPQIQISTELTEGPLSAHCTVTTTLPQTELSEVVVQRLPVPPCLGVEGRRVGGGRTYSDVVRGVYPPSPVLGEYAGQTDHVGKVVMGRSHCRGFRSHVYWAGSASHEEKRLRQAASSGNAELVTELLERGVNPRATDDKHRTALHLAAAAGNETIARLLLDHGADPNQKDVIGNTALHLATCTHNILIITLLLEKGTDLNALDRTGTSPLQMVISRLRLAQGNRLRHTTSDLFKNELCQIIDMMKAYLQRVEQRFGSLSLGGATASDARRDDDLDDICSRLERTTTLEEIDSIGGVLSDLACLKLERIKDMRTICSSAGSVLMGLGMPRL